jgi:CCR4-NOT transcription complex subunit 7/8
MSSGMVHRVTFHDGYDFGYIVKLLTGRKLPPTHADFFNLIKLYFAIVYDIKHLMKFRHLYGGLNRMAKLLHAERIGVCHQAGSDSLLTFCLYRKVREQYFDGLIEKYAGVVCMV